MKSITTKPPISLNLSCVNISIAASMLVVSAVSSISLPLVDLAELTSILTNASVESITILPPEGKFMFLLYTV